MCHNQKVEPMYHKHLVGHTKHHMLIVQHTNLIFLIVELTNHMLLIVAHTNRMPLLVEHTHHMLLLAKLTNHMLLIVEMEHTNLSLKATPMNQIPKVIMPVILKVKNLTANIKILVNFQCLKLTVLSRIKNHHSITHTTLILKLESLS